jgi:ankyrin repeat protein
MEPNPDDILRSAWTENDTADVIASLQAGSDPELRLQGVSLLTAASTLGRGQIVHALLMAGADPNRRSGDNGQTALMALAGTDALPAHDGILRELLARGAEMEAQDASGHTALDLAVRIGNLRSATSLIALGARMSHETKVKFSRLKSGAAAQTDQGINR